MKGITSYVGVPEDVLFEFGVGDADLFGELEDELDDDVEVLGDDVEVVLVDEFLEDAEEGGEAEDVDEEAGDVGDQVVFHELLDDGQVAGLDFELCLELAQVLDDQAFVEKLDEVGLLLGIRQQDVGSDLEIQLAQQLVRRVVSAHCQQEQSYQEDVLPYKIEPLTVLYPT